MSLLAPALQGWANIGGIDIERVAMAKGKKREIDLIAKRNRKAANMKTAGNKSRYARKKQWLAASKLYNFGFEVAEPKPWR